MAHFKKLPHVTRESKITYSSGIIDEIVLLAVSELEYVKFIYKKDDNFKDVIKISISKNLVDVWVDVQIHYTQSISEMAFKIQEAVRHNIETMTEYRVNSVNVKISGIFYDQIKKRNKDIKTEKLEVENTTSEKKEKEVAKAE